MKIRQQAGVHARRFRFTLWLGATGLLLSGCNASGPEQQASQPTATAAVQGIGPQTSINALMVAWMDHSAHELWDREKPGAAPRTDADWRELERHATQLLASGTLVSLGGTGELDMEWAQRPSWATRSQALSHAALSILNAVRARNFEQVVRSNGMLTDSCEGCHDEFKPSLPTEGIVHQPY
jgi:hypothetical protein